MPRVLNKHVDGTPKGAIYVGRPSKWGNPFVIGRDGTRSEVIEKYKHYINNKSDLQTLARRELKGCDLVCFCAPQPCHGDILMEIANQ